MADIKVITKKASQTRVYGKFSAMLYSADSEAYEESLAKFKIPSKPKDNNGVA